MSKEAFGEERCQAFSLPGARGGVLLVHGFTGSPGHMRYLGERLNERGFAARGILLPGHCTSLADFEKSGGARPWMQAVASAAEAMRREHRFLAVIGLSMGGTLALLAAERGLCDAVVPVCAAIRVHQRFTSLAGVVWPVMRYTPFKEPRFREGFLNEDDYGYNRAPVRRVADLRRLMRAARRGLPRITCPLLAVQSVYDETVRPASAQIICEGVSSADKDILWLSASPHVATIGPERAALADRVTAFLTRLAPPAE